VVAVLFAAVVATASLAVSATEQVLDGRRATAVLVALAASPRFVQRVVRRQLLLASVPAAVLGVLIGWLATSAFGSGQLPDPGSLLPLPLAVLVAALAAGGGALIAARLVRPAIQASSTPDNLRAP
jgi:predicted lysophospholipase L1 biosynthesis ABC-type transport system permease subunit